MFKQLEAVPNLSVQELEIIELWKKLNVVEKIKQLRKKSPQKVYYDGPITANNMPHYGHVVAWTLKDIVPRYWTMKGNYVSRNMGWDCQGLPVEIEVEKKLGFKNREDIISYGISKFNELCRQSVFEYRDSIFFYESRIGRWFDSSDVYYTMDSTFIESIWWSFKELFNKGFIYEGHKVVPYSTRAGCSLSHHEVAEGGYKEVEDPFVTIKLPIKGMEKTYALVWTTTPWTIPGNLLLAIGKKISYQKVESEGEFYILAATRVEEIFKGKKYKVISEVKSSDLVGLEYTPAFNFFENKRKEGCFKIVYADHANDEEGTGIVHQAPYGEEDFNLFMDLGIAIFDYLDEGAVFTDLIPPYKGMFYKDADLVIIEDLQKSNNLFGHGTITHRMPICYRTKTPLIYKPIKSWYLAVTKIKEKMIAENQRVNWVPDHLRDGMSHAWISGARDWAISRSRYWGTPIPIWINDKTGEMVVVGSFGELKEKTGRDVGDPHKPFVDEIVWKDKENGGTFRRVTEVLDVWYDSGSVPFAKLHYPFENKDKIDEMIPAEYIAEGLDQVRLWFYTMHILGVALFGKVPYKNVVVNGMMLAKDGEKLSKSKRNFPPMDDILEKYGADILRLFILNSPIVVAESARFYVEVLDDVKKEFFLPLWNTLRYFLTYANEYNFKPTGRKPNSKNVLDKWILTRLQKTVLDVDRYMSKYLFMNASRELPMFVQDLSTWYLRRSRIRLKEGNKEALNTLYYVLTQFAKLVAPMIPFFSEKMYELLDVKSISGFDSVHFDFYPTSKDLDPNQTELLDQMASDREVVTKFLAKRLEAKIAVRQPLAKIMTKGKVFFKDIVKDELNVKEVIDESGDDELDTNITKDLKLEGLYRDMVRKVQDLRKEKGLKVSEEINVVYEDTLELREVVSVFKKELCEKLVAKNLVPGGSYSITKI